MCEACMLHSKVINAGIEIGYRNCYTRNVKQIMPCSVSLETMRKSSESHKLYYSTSMLVCWHPELRSTWNVTWLSYLCSINTMNIVGTVSVVFSHCLVRWCMVAPCMFLAVVSNALKCTYLYVQPRYQMYGDLQNHMLYRGLRHIKSNFNRIDAISAATFGNRT